MHKEESNFKCRICAKNYNHLKNLKRHIATSHPGAQPQLDAVKVQKKFICRICNKELSRNEHLKRHLLTHTKETTKEEKDDDYEDNNKGDVDEQRCYNCDKCSQKFKNENDYLTHENCIADDMAKESDE